MLVKEILLNLPIPYLILQEIIVKLDIGNHEQQQNIDEEIDFSTPVSASHQKLKNYSNFIHSSDTYEEKFFFIMNFQILTELIQLVGLCKKCSSTNIFIKCTAKNDKDFLRAISFILLQNLCFLVKMQEAKNLSKLMLDL